MAQCSSGVSFYRKLNKNQAGVEMFDLYFNISLPWKEDGKPDLYIPLRGPPRGILDPDFP